MRAVTRRSSEASLAKREGTPALGRSAWKRTFWYAGFILLTRHLLLFSQTRPLGEISHTPREGCSFSCGRPR